MPKTDDLFASRKSLDQICSVPDKIISVYSLEKHVWADSNAESTRKARKPELQTIKEFQIEPVRPFLNDILRNMAAPYKPERRDNPIGQGYWIQAEFGSGKSHLLCFLSALSLGSKAAWDIIQKKEQKAGRGKRETVYRFWEEGLEAKRGNGKKGIFVIVKTLVGAGGGTVGLTDKGQRLSEYILDAAKEQLQLETGKNLSLYPTELLADRFLSEDLDRYRKYLGKFLRDPKFFEEDEFEEVNDFIRDIQQNKSPEYKRSCGNKLWRFYTEYLKVRPQIPAEDEDILRHLIETILMEGYSGVLIVLDEISLFMINRDEQQRWEDAKTLVVLANRLAKVHNLPVWTVCSAQQAIEARVADRNIIADDRLKLVRLLENPDDYYNIVLSRVRTIKEPTAIGNYFLYYKRGFTWPNVIGESEFHRFFPFHKPALEVLYSISYNLTTTRSAIAVMHQVLKHQIKRKGHELVRLWELFDETVRYDEDPSGTYASLSAIKTQFEGDYRAYEACVKQIDSLTRGTLKFHRDKSVKIIQTLFLYHVAKTRQQGITPEDIANSVLIEKDADANTDENIHHYESIAENLKKELRQIVQTMDEDNRPRYRFDPVFTGVNPRDEFRKARDEAESNELMQKEAWDHLLALDEWPIRTLQMTIDLSNGVRSIFRDISPFIAPWEERNGAKSGDQEIDVDWQRRQVFGLVGMRDLGRVHAENQILPLIDSDQSGRDFAVFVGTKPVSQDMINNLLSKRNDSRLILWSPSDLTKEENDLLLNFAAFRKLISDWQGKETEDASAVVTWVANSLQTDLGRIAKIVDSSYSRGRMDALNNSQMQFHVAGELSNILSPIVDRVLTVAYVSHDIKFEPPFIFKKEEGVKVINGIVKTGSIPKGVKPNQNISAAQNFGFGLKIIKKAAERTLDTSDNQYVKDIWAFIDDKLADAGQTMKMETLYKNFMGIGGPKDYGLTMRMVQIYLLCLVRDGKIRIGIGPKSGLPIQVIDYSNIAEIEYSTKVLDSLTEVQKMTKPENWEVLRPYAEKLLGEALPSTHDDAIISGYRKKLKDLFGREKEEAARTIGRAKGLFEALKVANPYETELVQVTKLFSHNLEGSDDIQMVLYALKDALGYQAFDTNNPSHAEVDDLANRLKNYSDIKRFLEFETELFALQAYCVHTLPDNKDLKKVKEIQQKVCGKLSSLKTYIDEEVILKTELIGKIPAEENETETFGALIREYKTVYTALHDAVIDCAETCRNDIADILNSDDMKALKMLETIDALQPTVSDEIEQKLTRLSEMVFACPSSRGSIEEQIRRGPVHECGLSFQNASEHLTEIAGTAADADSIFNVAFNGKLEIFMNPTIQERLEQGKSEPIIAGLLKAKTVDEVRGYLVKECIKNPSIIDIIQRYLKRIQMKKVRIADFKPSITTVEKQQIPTVVQEFQKYLEDELQGVEKEKDFLPMLKLE